MFVNRTLMLSVYVIFGCNVFSIKAAEDLNSEDSALMAKIIGAGLKCFKDVDWRTCNEMLVNTYDISQPKYKQCTCLLACAGEEIGLINTNGESNPSKFLELMDRVKNPSIKSQMQSIHDKCQNVKGTEKCDLSEQFVKCVFRESPVLKEKVSMMVETVSKMKSK